VSDREDKSKLAELLLEEVDNEQAYRANREKILE
jgi:hypothetical protein